MFNNSFENIYDKHSAMLFGIALELSSTEIEAEEILIKTCKKIHEYNLMLETNSSLCVTLIKLVIQTAKEQLKPNEIKHNFKFKHYENTPLLHKLLCEQKNLESYLIENNLSRVEIGKMLRKEFNLLRKMQQRELKLSEFF
jgi:hypothetical protein